jgi:hypothetical protein
MQTLDVTTTKVVTVAMLGDKFLIDDYQGVEFPERYYTDYSLTDDLRRATQFREDATPKALADQVYYYNDDVRMVKVRVTTTLEVL